MGVTIALMDAVGLKVCASRLPVRVEVADDGRPIARIGYVIRWDETGRWRVWHHAGGTERQQRTLFALAVTLINERPQHPEWRHCVHSRFGGYWYTWIVVPVDPHELGRTLEAAASFPSPALSLLGPDL